jgi:DNA-binding beta-propeller fold protein YncE
VSAPDRYVYWTNYQGSLMRVGVAGGVPETVVANAGSYPNGVDIDRETGRIYWAERGNDLIRSVAADGTDHQVLNVGGATINDPVGVAIDKRRGRILWANSWEPGSIGWASLDGSGQGGTLNTGALDFPDPQGVAIDAVADRLYWANTDTSIAPANWVKLDGSGETGAIGTPSLLGTPVGMAFVPTLQKIFWGLYSPVGSAHVSGAPTSGGPDTPLATAGMAIASPGGIGYDGATGRLLVSDYDGELIGYAAADGSGGGLLTTASAGSPWGAPAATGAGSLTSSNSPLSISGTVGSTTAGTLQIKNTGNYPIQMIGTTSSSSLFAPGAGCPGHLTVNEACELTIAFSPTSADAASASIEISTDAGKFSFTVKGTASAAPSTEVKLTDVKAVKRCAEPDEAGKLSVGFTSATAAKLDVTLQRSSTQRRAMPIRCPQRAGQTDFISKLIGKQSKKSFTALAGRQSSTLKQMFGTKKLSSGRYRMLFNYKNSSGETVRKGTWFWVLNK